MNVIRCAIPIILVCYSSLAQAVTEVGSLETLVQPQENNGVQKTNIQQIKVLRSKRTTLDVKHPFEKKEGTAFKKKEPRVDETALWDLYHVEEFEQLRIAIEKRQQQDKNWQPSSELMQAIAAKDTDERQLWNLYHQKEYTEVYYRIDALVKRYPGWQPSEGLFEALKAARMDEQDLWVLLQAGQFKEVERTIQRRQQQDQQWRPSQQLSAALKQAQTDERPLWELYHQGNMDELEIKVTALHQAFPDWKLSPELQQALENPSEKHQQALEKNSEESQAGGDIAIWNMIHQKKYRQATQAVKALRREQAGWQPSVDMQKSLQDGIVDSQIQQAMKGKHWTKIIGLSRNYPQAFDCSHYHRRLSLSTALAHGRHLQRAAQVYKKTLRQCKEYIRVDSIEHALDHLPVKHLTPLFKLLEKRRVSKQVKNRMAIARYRYIMKKGAEKTDLPLLLDDEVEIVAHNDANLTGSLAWNYLTLGENNHALNLFRHVRSSQDSNNLLKGEILALDRLNDMAALKDLINKHHERLKQAGMLKDLLPLLAKACAAESNAQCNVDTFQELKTYRPLSVDESEILAWGLYNIDHYTEAAEHFAVLYQREQTENNAKGVYVSAYKTGQIDRANDLAATYHGPLAKLLGSQVANHLYQRKKFHAAFAVSDEPKEALRNIDSSWVRAGYWMSSNRMPVMAPVILQLNQQHYVIKGVDYLDHRSSDAMMIEVDHVFLDAGAPIIPAGDLAGTAPIVPIAATFPIRSRLKGYEWKIGYMHEGWKSWYFHVGQGLVGGSVPATFKGDFGIVNQLEQGFVGAKIYREPIRDFLLPYAGLQDPFTPQRWGKVMRNGLEVNGYQNISQLDGLGLSYSFKSELLDGHNVEINNHISTDLTMPYTVELANMNVSVGPNIRWERYQSNQMHWTFGHGGYFSPQHWLSWGINTNLISKEGKDSSFRVFGSAGFQIFTLDSSLVLPLANDGRVYPATKIRNRHETLEAQFLHRFTDHLHIEVGAKKSRSHLSKWGVTSSFGTWEGHIFATWYFDKRSATFTPEMEEFRSDLDLF
ncbi:MAG: cellulose synthase subunit BcsC-related outer membrane protein [Mariprofundaceae bacterium]|nr:cellulose synthase subunit BcsC-related outer membrane protein [Mariprofundaceae bacterium]